MRKLTTQDFIYRARDIHGDRYGYSLSVYQGNKIKLFIYCPEHRVFEQTPSDHFQGRGCPKCGDRSASIKNRADSDSFIKKANIVHGTGTFDYSLVEYEKSRTKVKIICKIHGVFKQSPNNHLSGQGCQLCYGNKKHNVESFISKSRGVHGDKYDYSLVDYQNTWTKVKIICPHHGLFKQNPDNHFSGQGCPGCGNYGFDQTKEGYVYLLRSECGQYVKVGITHKPKERHVQLSKATPFPFHVIECVKATGSKVANVEREILNSFEPACFTDSFDGSTEWLLWSDSLRNTMIELIKKDN